MPIQRWLDFVRTGRAEDLSDLLAAERYSATAIFDTSGSEQPGDPVNPGRTTFSAGPSLRRPEFSDFVLDGRRTTGGHLSCAETEFQVVNSEKSQPGIRFRRKCGLRSALTGFCCAG
jgi:hypothetical protein